MNRQEKLFAVQKYNFAAYDLLLYLDTHPNDKKAFCMFQNLVKKFKKAKREYEEAFGPLEAFNAANFEEFTWLDSPWPWERGANLNV